MLTPRRGVEIGRIGEESVSEVELSPRRKNELTPILPQMKDFFWHRRPRDCSARTTGARCAAKLGKRSHISRNGRLTQRTFILAQNTTPMLTGRNTKRLQPNSRFVRTSESRNTSRNDADEADVAHSTRAGSSRRPISPHRHHEITREPPSTRGGHVSPPAPPLHGQI
jgi:hypothetical protein